MLWRAVIGSLFCLCLGSCAGTDRRITLRVANWGGAADDSEYFRTIREIYTEFERQNPDIRIQVEGIPGSSEYVSKILLSHVARAAPDVITLDASSAAAFIDNGVLRDLRPHMRSETSFDLGDYFPNVVAIAQRKDQVYAVPMDFTPMVMYYNKDLFDAAGESYPRPGWTTADFLAKAKRLTKGDVYGFKFANWMPGWIIWLWNRGGDVADWNAVSKEGAPFQARGVFDSEANVATVGFLRDLVEKHRVAPSLSSTAAQGIDPFANGKAAMEVNGHWALVGYSQQPALNLERIGVVELPSDVGRSQTVMYEAGLAIGKHCKNPDAAWKFICYMSSAEVQRKYHTTGIAISARKDISQERATDDREREFLRIVPSARPPWGSRVTGYELVEDQGQKMMDAVMKSGYDPKRALSEFAARIDQEFDRP